MRSMGAQRARGANVCGVAPANTHTIHPFNSACVHMIALPSSGYVSCVCAACAALRIEPGGAQRDD